MGRWCYVIIRHSPSAFTWLNSTLIINWIKICDYLYYLYMMIWIFKLIMLPSAFPFHSFHHQINTDNYYSSTYYSKNGNNYGICSTIIIITLFTWLFIHDCKFYWKIMHQYYYTRMYFYKSRYNEYSFNFTLHSINS